MWRWFYSYILAQMIVYFIGLVSTALPFFPKEIIPENLLLFGTVSIPLQSIIMNVLIPLLIRGLDKYKYEYSKISSVREVDEQPKGLPGFQIFG